jgi:hypothetical protein
MLFLPRYYFTDNKLDEKAGHKTIMMLKRGDDKQKQQQMVYGWKKVIVNELHKFVMV